MKNLVFSLLVAMALIACSQKPEAEKTEGNSVPSEQPNTVIKQEHSAAASLNQLFTLPDAEIILGGPAHITDSTMGSQANISAYKSSYVSNAKSAKSGDVNFLVEEFIRIVDAQNKYSIMKATSEIQPGFKSLHDLGDEAYFRSDDKTMYQLMVRKGNRVMNFRVHKVPDKAALDDFNRVAKTVADKL